ncbi:MAG TPA: plastocyanin/azurin family copper-binding protein [Candidatus Binataceae bacterium]|nr:plastocyanin/azurin family copper-binding protein [Candidatus Binataceae bacterium]
MSHSVIIAHMKDAESDSPGNRAAVSQRRRTKFRAMLVLAAATLVVGIAVVAWIAQGPKIVRMEDSPLGGFFEPDKLTIRAGTTVQWKNYGLMVHDATDRRDLAVRASDVDYPAGVGPFDSGFLPPGRTFSYTFTVPGTYKYVCVPHELGGMTGQITVTNGWLW